MGYQRRVPPFSIEGLATPCEVYQSPNDSGPRPHTYGVILHSTRSGRTGEDALTEEYMLTVNYMMRPKTVSAHRVIGYHKGQHAQLVEDDLIAWHAGSDNIEYLGIEFTQPLPTDPFSEYQYEVGAAVVRMLAWKYKFPLDRWHVRQHQDTVQGRRDGKSDPGNMWDYEGFLKRLSD